ncbi:cytosolic protein [Ornithinibacillus gellani]|uniref:cytosolic protein n=1 Tax=Ornithinibacillus gellani TaxID=2293253 RepID=UPI000F4A63C1|nr:cytosolic protein [Ornithinibacillus gellani]TQS75993.1 cytosolic protein [Ornithinibacillus gellani]
MSDRNEKYTDFDNVEKMREYINPEEFPEGSVGSTIRANEPVTGKSTPWKQGQRSRSAYVYEDKAFHEDIPRQAPGAHPLHDEPNEKQP